jgi:hypothetical protein
MYGFGYSNYLTIHNMLSSRWIMVFSIQGIAKDSKSFATRWSPLLGCSTVVAIFIDQTKMPRQYV